MVPTPARPARGREIAGLAVITLAILWAYGIFSTTKLVHLFTVNKDTTEYYHSLVDGFRRGQTSLTLKPPAELAALADPYDPQQRAGLSQTVLHDATYYKGRYYLYFGVTPAVILLLPFRLLTGSQFPQGLATVVFCAGGYLASLGLLLALRRRYLPNCRTGAVWLAALLLGLGNLCLMMLTRNSVWELPIASAYCFSCLGYWLVFQGFTESRVDNWRLLLAGCCFALTVGSRPTFIFCVIALGGLWLWSGRRRGFGAERWREGLALFIPVAVGVAGLLAYNYARFDHPLDFGMEHQLAGGNNLQTKLTSREFVPVNFYYYFLAPAQWQRYFPFVEVIGDYPGVRPASYLGMEDPFGLLPNMPFWLLAAAAPVMWSCWFRGQHALRAWMWFFGLCFAATVSPVLFFGGATNRYMVDFLPPLLLLAGMGLLMLGSLDAGFRPGRWLRRGAGAVVSLTVAFNIFVAFQHNGMFNAHRHDAFVALARWFNQPVMWWERHYAEAYGPVEVTVRFPRNRPGHVEPVVVTGVAYRSDYLYVYYDPDGRYIKLGYTRTNHEELLSQPIPVDYGEAHRIGLHSGALYPPVGHPFYAEWSPERVQEAKRSFQITLDGVPYLKGEQDFFDTTPGFVRVGQNDVSKYTDPKFTGEVIRVSRELPASIPFSGNAFVRLAFTLPNGAAGKREPLLATGGAGAGDLLFINYVDETHVRLGFEHTGTDPILSDPLPVAPGEINLLEASFGSFYPAPQTSDARELAKNLIVRFRGQLVWAEPRVFHPPGTQPAVFGINSFHSPACTETFSGGMVAVQPVPAATRRGGAAPFVFRPYMLVAGTEPGYGPVRLHLDFPKGLSATFEPLLVSGPSRERADYLWIRYVDAGNIIIGYEHTGGGGPNSGVVPVDFNRPHLLEIDLPSLYPTADDDYFNGGSLVTAIMAKNQARIRLDGATRIEAPVKAYDSTPAQSAIGENRVTDTFGRKFTGRIIRLERGTHAMPEGFAEKTGALELTVTWPEVLPEGTRESILATGPEGKQDSLLISYEGAQRARVLLQSHDGKLLTGAPVPIVAGGRQVLLIEWGGFFSDAARPARVTPEEWRRKQQTCTVKIDGIRALDGQGNFAMADPQEVALGAAFTGGIVAVRRLAGDQN